MIYIEFPCQKIQKGNILNSLKYFNLQISVKQLIKFDCRKRSNKGTDSFIFWIANNTIVSI